MSTVNTQLQAKIEEHKSARNDLSSLLTSTHIAVLFLDMQLCIRRFTPQVRELFEMLDSDIGRPLSDLEKKFTDPDLERDAGRVLTTLVPVEREVHAEADRWFLRRLTPYRTGDDRIAGVVASFVDISGRMTAELALRSSEERLRTQYDRSIEILESVSDAFFAVDASFGFTYINRKAEALWGRRREDLQGRNCRDEFARVDDVELSNLHATAMERRQPVQAELFSHLVNRWIDVSIYPESGGGLSCYFREITERKRAEEALRASEERFRLLVEGANDFAMMMLNADGLVTAWNTGAERLLGYSEAEAIGMDATIIFTPDDRAHGAPEREMRLAKAAGRSDDERWHLHKNQTQFWGSGVLSVLRNADGSVRGFVKVLRDETPRKRADEALVASKTAAEEANRSKDEFLAVLSHELRTPLSAILLWTRMLQDTAGPMSDEMHEGLSAIRSSADAQKELVEDLLDVSRITSGKLRLQMREVALLPVVREAVEAISPTAQAKGIELVAHLADDAGVVRADAGRLRQVIWNLLTNAVKFTPSKGRVKVEMIRNGPEVEIHVIDTGRGMSAAFLPHVFERFRQADGTSTRTQGGMGLGLTIARQLVELHGGVITAESLGEGRGATFRVRLPLAETEAMRSPRHMLPTDGNDVIAGVNVLLVEDDRLTLHALATHLRHAGMRVIEAESARAGVEAFSQSKPRIIVSDIGMPDEDGISMIRRIRELERKSGSAPTPAIALTAFARDSDRKGTMTAGYQRHLAKPVELEQLLSILAELLIEDKHLA